MSVCAKRFKGFLLCSNFNNIKNRKLEKQELKKNY